MSCVLVLLPLHDAHSAVMLKGGVGAVTVCSDDLGPVAAVQVDLVKSRYMNQPFDMVR